MNKEALVDTCMYERSIQALRHHDGIETFCVPPPLYASMHIVKQPPPGEHGQELDQRNVNEGNVSNEIKCLQSLELLKQKNPFPCYLSFQLQQPRARPPESASLSVGSFSSRTATAQLPWMALAYEALFQLL